MRARDAFKIPRDRIPLLLTNRRNQRLRTLVIVVWLLSQMGGIATVVGVKRVNEGMPPAEWDGSMPLPGDIVKGVALAAGEEGEEICPPYSSAKSRSELSGMLGQFRRQHGSLWVQVQRGNALLELRARVASYRGKNFYRRFTVMADRDDRHVAVLGDLTLERCTELQEMSRTVANLDGSGGFDKKKGISYDWKKKVGTYLPDRHSTLISSVLFKPFRSERSVEATTRRSMAWFSAAVSSGVPLVFVNIQTEQSSLRRDMSCHKQQSSKSPPSTVEPGQGIRLWFLPGISEVPVVLTPEEGETRFGMDIKRTEEGFICVNSVAKGSAADRAGIRDLFCEARKTGHLVVISRVQGKGVLPSEISSEGLIRCSDQAIIKERLMATIQDLEEVHLHIMGWPNHGPSAANCKMNGPAILLPPAGTDASAFSHKPDLIS